MYDLVCIGNPVYDIIETPYVKTDNRVLSGCSVNAAITAKKLGLSRIALVGCVGEDYKSRLSLDLARLGLNGSYLKVRAETGGFRLTYTSDLRDRVLDIIGVAGKIEIEDLPADLLDAKFVLIGPILHEVDVDLIRHVRRVSKAQIFLDPQGFTRREGKGKRVEHTVDEEEIREVVKLADYVKPNEVEAALMTGLGPEEAAKELVRWGAKVGIVTMADRGSVIYEDGRLHKVPAYRTKAIDPTGAGDVYAGAFIYKRIEGASLLEAALFASAVASIKVEYVGPDFPLTRLEGERRYKSLVGGG